MWTVIGRRLLWAIPLIIFVTMLVFLLLELAPGDAARALVGEDARPEQVEQVRERLGLDDPLPERYARWLGNAVQGDFGESLITGQSVSGEIVRAMPPTLSIVAVAAVFSIPIAVLLGCLAAVRPRGLLDRTITLVSSTLVATPAFVVAIFALSVVAVGKKWLPAVGYTSFGDSPIEWLKHLLLPALSLGALLIGEVTRHVHSSLLNVLDKDYIVASRARGMSRTRVVFKHGLKNAAVPVITVLGLRLSQMVAGTAIIEPLFLIRGMGSATITAVLNRDLTVVLGIVTVLAVLVLIINLLVDVSYIYLNPKTRT